MRWSLPRHPGCVVPLALVAATCASRPLVEPRVTEAQAIEIARHEVSFEPDTVDAVLSEDEPGRSVWRVTLRGRVPGQPPGLFETVIVDVDADTGDVVKIART